MEAAHTSPNLAIPIASALADMQDKLPEVLRVKDPRAWTMEDVSVWVASWGPPFTSLPSFPLPPSRSLSLLQKMPSGMASVGRNWFASTFFWKRLTALPDHASGLKWTKCPKQPFPGQALVATYLSDLRQALEHQTEFTQGEWELFGIENLRMDHFVEVQGKDGKSVFYKPFQDKYHYFNVRRWTRDVDVFKCDKMIIPINVSEAPSPPCLPT